MSLNCPACETTTLASFQDTASGLEVESCAKCAGMWFDENTLPRFLESATFKRNYLDQKPHRNESDFTINTTARTCPRCRIPMDDCLFGGVTLDRCSRCHGLWFDGGELAVVVARYRMGAHGDREIAHELREGLGDPTAAADDDTKASVLASVHEFLASLERGKK